MSDPLTTRSRRHEWMAAAAILAVVASYLAFGLRTAANSLGCFIVGARLAGEAPTSSTASRVRPADAPTLEPIA